VRTVNVIKLFVSICFIYGLFFSFPVVYAADGDIDKVLFSAESLFKALKGKNYTEVWKFLTVKSKSIIVDDVSREAKKLGGKVSRGQLSDDFASGGPIATAYWNSFVETFDPDVVLEHSKWKLTVVKDEYAEINILYKKAEKPAILKVFKEDSMWKVGLEETFRTRKWFIY
jgi:hypothetical protein